MLAVGLYNCWFLFHVEVLLCVKVPVCLTDTSFRRQRRNYDLFAK